MTKDRYNENEDIPTRKDESPAHKKRRAVRSQLRTFDVEHLDEYEDEELETYEPIKKQKNGGRRSQ